MASRMVKKAAKKVVKKTLKKTVKKISERRGRRKKPSPLALVKSEANPIIAPQPENLWEAWQTFNPGVIELGGQVHFIYRAIGPDGISRFGYAASPDGFTLTERLLHPVYEHLDFGPNPYAFYSFSSGGSCAGAEDARLVRVGDEDKIFMTYTACEAGLRMTLTTIKADDFLHRRFNWTKPIFLSPPGTVNKNWVIFPEKINGRYAILHSLSPAPAVAYFDDLESGDGGYLTSSFQSAHRTDVWDNWVRGAGAPPVKTPHGWLLFYHAISDADPGKYKVGALLLDLADPTKILARATEPILEPTEEYENSGYKAGVVYVSGAIIKDGELLVYYGGSDSYVCVASAKLDQFLQALITTGRPRVTRRLLRRLA